jgi:HAD superfamily hydrolase (TIGR01509 family)
MKTILVDAYNTFVIAGRGIDKEMHELLEEYPNAKIILTNANDEQMVEFGLDDVPYPVFTLKHEPDKIELEYYYKMLEHFDLIPDEVVYFEHNADAVRSARSVGIVTHHFDKDIRDLKALKKFLDENVWGSIIKSC